MIFRTICLIFLSALFTSCSSTTVRIHPRSPEDKIRNVVLQHTPLGSSPESVMRFIETRLRHKGTPELGNRGARKRSLRPLNSGIPGSRNIDEWIGSKSISDLEVGWYWTRAPLLPMITYVYVSWAFDSEDHLIEVLVYEEIDAP